jgi:pyruvate,water dikinase
VLITTTTTPAWTPLFPSLAALVTETGGILSHGAIVAREYGIPAVVGAAGATGVVPDGARVRVDGASGLVELV